MPYTPPHRYTAEELLDAEIEDLLVDYRCAIRDGLYEYAADVASQVIVKRLEREALDIWPLADDTEGR